MSKPKLPKLPNVRECYLAELILCGGAIVSRGTAAGQLAREGVSRTAIDWCVYAVPMLSDEELRGLVRTELIFQLRLRYQGIFREQARRERG